MNEQYVWVRLRHKWFVFRPLRGALQWTQVWWAWPEPKVCEEETSGVGGIPEPAATQELYRGRIQTTADIVCRLLTRHIHSVSV